MAIEVLTCEVCGKEWERKVTTGNKPRNCTSECRDEFRKMQQRKASARWRERHPEKVKDGRDRYKNSEHGKATMIKYRNENKDKARERSIAWREKNRERDKANAQEYYLQNKEEFQRRSKEWYLSNQELVLDRSKIRRQENPDRYNAYSSSYRARKRNAWVEDVYIQVLMDRDEGICGICKGDIPTNLDWPHPLYPTVDHTVPLSKGGEHSYANTQPTHWSCNDQKSNKLDGWQNIKPILNQEERTWQDQAQEMTTQNTSATTLERSSNGASM